jgi:hypothetical protein
MVHGTALSARIADSMSLKYPGVLRRHAEISASSRICERRSSRREAIQKFALWILDCFGAKEAPRNDEMKYLFLDLS